MVAALGGNCRGRGRHMCFVEAAGMTHTAEGFLVLERARAPAQCLKDGTVTLRSQLHVLMWLERGGACPRRPQVSSPCPVSPAWAAYPPGTVKGRGCCCTLASLTFCRRTGEWAACGPRRPGARRPVLLDSFSAPSARDRSSGRSGRLASLAFKRWIVSLILPGCWLCPAPRNTAYTSGELSQSSAAAG